MFQVVPVASLCITVHLFFSKLRLSSLGLSLYVMFLNHLNLSGHLDLTQTPDTALPVLEGGQRITSLVCYLSSFQSAGIELDALLTNV